jgi:predicted RNA binding protein YcfA (HicA-like mRNA interferase family)
MARLPRVTAAQVIRVLEAIGFVLTRQTGHKICKDDRGMRVTVPCHAGKIPKPKALKGILNDAGLSVEQFDHLLHE